MPLLRLENLLSNLPLTGQRQFLTGIVGDDFEGFDGFEDFDGLEDFDVR